MILMIENYDSFTYNLVHRGMAYVQAGAGIVADSQAAREYDETRNKTCGLLKAIELAEAG